MAPDENDCILESQTGGCEEEKHEKISNQKGSSGVMQKQKPESH